MNNSTYRFIQLTAMVLIVAWVGWTVYDGLLRERVPGDRAYQAASRYFEDGYYQKALETYREAIAENPRHIQARRGRALALMQLNREAEALAVFNRLIEEKASGLGAIYANRGILHDRLGHYRQAVADYEQALKLQPELAAGPGWLTRFFRLQPEKPPTIADRAAYLRAELAKPEAERLLRLPEKDAEQQPYKQ